MKQSEQIDQFATALCKFQRSVKGAKKDSTAKIPTKDGGGYSYNYSDLEAVWQAARCDDLLSECGLSICQTGGYIPMGDDVLDTLETMLLHTSGQWKAGERVLRLKSNDAQAQGSAITYVRRYDMCAILGIATVDDDGATATAHARETMTVRQPDMPLCPNPVCGKPLRKDKNDPNKYYCWAAKGGCGYDSSRDAAPEDNEEAGNYTTNQTVDAAKWDELKRVGLENKWPEAFMRQSIDSKRRQGLSQSEIFDECWEKWSKPNGRAVEDGALTAAGMTEEELPF